MGSSNAVLDEISNTVSSRFMSNREILLSKTVLLLEDAEVSVSTNLDSMSFNSLCVLR